MNTDIIKSKEQLKPENDGVKFINIWANGNTELGKQLSSFYKSQFIHPYFGTFNCLEGFWHFIVTGRKDDKFRELIGNSARMHAKRLNQWERVESFSEIILAANYYKIKQNPEIRKNLIESSLPFEMYYIFNPNKTENVGNNSTVISQKNSDWLLPMYEEIRKMFQHGTELEPLNYDELFGK